MALAVTDYAGHEITGVILYATDGSVLIGQKASAASLSTVPASDIPDATYIGDIKFGEALPAGSAVLGTIRATNPDGTNIGGTGGSSHTDDASFTPATDDGTVMMAVADETAPDSVDEGDAGAVRMTLNRILKVVPTLSNGNGNAPAAGVQDHQQSLYGDVLIASAVYSADQNSPTQYNHNHRGCLLQLNIDANPGGGETLTMKVQVKIGNGAFITIFASAALTGNNRYNYVVHPNWGAAAQEITAVGNYALPRVWQVTMDHSAAGNWTYDLQFSYLD
ncbi:MAG: hypothetical protein HYX94_10075 [Chloroflexi bacterium]|nr:hypothetical protein [Chloroflexota bacterium]